MNGTTLYVPTLTVVLYADRADLPLAFGNEMRITFDVEHALATELSVYPWIVAPNPSVSKSVAFTLALDYINKTNPESSFSSGKIYFAFDFLHSSLAYQVEASYGNAPSLSTYRVWVDAYISRITYAVETIPPPGGTLTGFPMPIGDERPSEFSTYLWIQIGAITGSVLILLSILNVEAATVATFSVIMPLYVRIKKDQALDHFLRGQLYNHIVSNPGVTYSEIKNAFGLNNGTTTYHLAVLEILGYIRSSKDGTRRSYSPLGLEKKDVRRTLTGLQQAILGVVRSHGAAAPSDVARVIGISKQRASYNLRRMAEYGLVIEDERFRGRYTMSSSSKTQPQQA